MELPLLVGECGSAARETTLWAWVPETRVQPRIAASRSVCLFGDPRSTAPCEACPWAWSQLGIVGFASSAVGGWASSTVLDTHPATAAGAPGLLAGGRLAMDGRLSCASLLRG